MGYIEIFLAIFTSLILFSYLFHNKNGLPTNWPLIGMLPALLKNIHNIHDFLVGLMDKSLLTFIYKGPWFTNMNLLITADPANVHYIFSKNFANYPKGPKLKEILDVFGDGVINTDSDLWRYHRKNANSFLSHPQFNKFLINKLWQKVENGLIPVLDHVSKHGLEIDLQDLFERFTFDTITTFIMDHDPTTLQVDLPIIPSSKALMDVEETIIYRHIVPAVVWKTQRWLCVGQERKYRQGWEVIDEFVYKCLSKKKESKLHNELGGVDLITLYMEEAKQNPIIGNNTDKFLRDMFLNFLLAGRDTTSVALSWFFYLLSKNPRVLSKIKEEIKVHSVKYMSKNFEEINEKLVYLHGALCEALRLYPPVSFEAKVPLEVDVLPSGHKVDPNMQIILSLYAMGRMRTIWGEDCYEFKPERWICKRGLLRHEPSYKFLSFNAGPRTCVGKSMAFTQMKAVAIALISNYRIEPVQGHPVIPDTSVILRMKRGFRLRFLLLMIKILYYMVL